MQIGSVRLALEAIIVVLLVVIALQLVAMNDRSFAEQRILRDTCEAVVAAEPTTNFAVSPFKLPRC